MNLHRDDFRLGAGPYLLSHSIGRPLKDAEAALSQSLFTPWGGPGNDTWPQWLALIDQFRGQLGQLFSVPAEGFCPQGNVSSGLTKLAMALPRLQRGQKVLLSEQDFPTIGFVLRQALPGGADQLRFIPASQDVTDANVWADAMSPDIGLVFVSHAYSNTGQQAPVAAICAEARHRGILSLLDLAQSAGVLPLSLAQSAPDFALGSCVKWLCGGAGAGYLWVAPQRLSECAPKDVGWFSHQDPFEMDIHDFRYHPGANRFWGGTPSVAPFAIAAHSLNYLNGVGVEAIRAHNLALQQGVIEALGERIVSPHGETQRSGTLVLQLGERQPLLVQALAEAGIEVDQRPTGVRLSPHLYNTPAEMGQLVSLVQSVS
ncbi:aminotransferase class V-fold PLP-dependent enzyme [Ferrimonas marina]|uniref:Selenocysteine lyase/Cysteine desulfurase n=1 Tax=Ferrimonas marina TaxID=299255 RepID=A0A1M5Y1C8_9GAMM|nr:aminotransferase class V-fold PLP-dependent enzyme [Ferrimonas marina]SHI05313.1 Selenocysteine lyase/Cysteine desulfurase [Ferrimonas marina]